MKRILFPIFIAIFATIVIADNRTMVIVKKDGNMHAIHNEEVDSIAFSQFDLPEKYYNLQNDTIINYVEVHDTIDNFVEVHDTLYVQNEVEVHDTLYITNNVEVHDTLYVQNEVEVHDTLYITNNVEVHDTIFVEKTVRDTIYVTNTVEVHDTIKVEVEVPVMIHDTIYIEKSQNTPSPEALNGHGYVDFGIKDSEGNSVYWATCNVGACNPVDSGDYFAWGEHLPKTNYNQDTYLYRDQNTWEYFDLGENIAGTYFDAAHHIWGGAWRMPSPSDVADLFEHCDISWEDIKNTNDELIPCCVLTSKTDDKQKLYLPASGIYRNDSITEKGKTGCFWLSESTIHPYVNFAVDMFFDMDNEGWGYGDTYRYYGLSIRPICVVPNK